MKELMTKCVNRVNIVMKEESLSRSKVSLFIDGAIQNKTQLSTNNQVSIFGFKRKVSMGNCQEYSYFTCSARANIPAANGAEAEVPVCLVVQVFRRSVVACTMQIKTIKLFEHELNLVFFTDICRFQWRLKNQIEILEKITEITQQRSRNIVISKSLYIFIYS